MSWPLQQSIKLFITILLLCVSPWGYAESPVRITMLLSGDSQLYYNAVDGVEEELNKILGLEFKISTVSDFNDREINEVNISSDYIIAVGTKALRYVASSRTTVPVLNILVAKHTYNAISQNSDQEQDYSVIYLDQPAERLLLLAKIVLGTRSNKIGMLFGPTSVSEKSGYTVAAENSSIRLISRVENAENVSLEVIESLIKETDGYIALYDREVLNRKIAKWLLYIANVHRKPVIAYSKSYVEAGAIAAAYTTPLDAGRSAAGWIVGNIQSTKPIVWKKYPERFTVDVNNKIAAKLNISVEDSDVISAKIRNAEVKR